MSKRLKKSKKDDQIVIDEKKGQLYIGDKDLRLLMLRPIDLIEFTEFAGTNAEDIIIWVGKSLSKYFIENLLPEKDLSLEDLSTKKIIFINVLETFEHLGYGILNSKFKKDNILVSVENPLSSEDKDNIMSKNICFLYQGLFNGVLEQLGIEAEGKEIKCYLLGDEACVFQFDLLINEFSEEDIDKEEEAPDVANFLSSL